MNALGSRNKSDREITCLLGNISIGGDTLLIWMAKARFYFGLGGSVGFYEKAIENARKARKDMESRVDHDRHRDDKKAMGFIIGLSYAAIKKGVGCSTVEEGGASLPSDWELEEFARLRSDWLGLSVALKKKFLKVRIARLIREVGYRYGDLGADALEKVLEFAKRKRGWVLWVCRTCCKNFYTSEECLDHLEREHTVPRSRREYYSPQRVCEDWSGMISNGSWEPVDTVAAVQMIRDQVRRFVYQDGWCKDWPLAADGDRSQLLREIRSLLVSFIQKKILSASIRDRVIHFVAEKFERLQLSQQMLNDCRLLKTPQGICFLESRELNQILIFLRRFKFGRYDGVHLVCRAVDRIWQKARVKENIDFDLEFSFLLLDKRLLKGEVDHFDNEAGRIKCFDHTFHYEKTVLCGEAIVPWLQDRFNKEEDGFDFPKPIHTQNLEIWLPLLTALKKTSISLEVKFARKLQLLEDHKALLDQIRDKDDDSLELLEVQEELALIDSRILLIEDSRTRLLHALVSIAFFDYRFYILPVIKKFLVTCLQRDIMPSSM